MRLRYGVIALLCVGAVVWMVVLMQRNVVFFYPVSEAVAKSSHQTLHRIRIGGAVVPKSITERGDGVDFKLTEGDVTVTIHHTGDEPGLFKDCAPVVAEGHWDTPGSSTFDSTRLLIKHGNDYKPPKDAVAQCPKRPFGT
jgi:cytochrome c-type biogenesis protein CcmE